MGTDATVVSEFLKAHSPVRPEVDLGKKASYTIHQGRHGGEEQSQDSRLRGTESVASKKKKKAVTEEDLSLEQRLHAEQAPSPFESVPARVQQAAESMHGYACVTGLREDGHADWGVCGRGPGEILARVVV